MLVDEYNKDLVQYTIHSCEKKKIRQTLLLNIILQKEIAKYNLKWIKQNKICVSYFFEVC